MTDPHTLISALALVALAVVAVMSGLQSQKVITLQSGLINQLGDKLCANSDWQIERIKAETEAARAWTERVRPLDPAPGTNGWTPPQEIPDTVIPSRTE